MADPISDALDGLADTTMKAVHDALADVSTPLANEVSIIVGASIAGEIGKVKALLPGPVAKGKDAE